MCDCEIGSYCEHFRRKVTKRVWEVIHNVNVTPDVREKFLMLWSGKEVEAFPAATFQRSFQPKRIPPEPKHAAQPKTGGCGCKKQ